MYYESLKKKKSKNCLNHTIFSIHTVFSCTPTVIYRIITFLLGVHRMWLSSLELNQQFFIKRNFRISRQGCNLVSSFIATKAECKVIEQSILTMKILIEFLFHYWLSDSLQPSPLPFYSIDVRHWVLHRIYNFLKLTVQGQMTGNGFKRARNSSQFYIRSGSMELKSVAKMKALI